MYFLTIVPKYLKPTIIIPSASAKSKIPFRDLKSDRVQFTVLIGYRVPDFKNGKKPNSGSGSAQDQDSSFTILARTRSKNLKCTMYEIDLKIEKCSQIFTRLQSDRSSIIQFDMCTRLCFRLCFKTDTFLETAINR